MLEKARKRSLEAKATMLASCLLLIISALGAARAQNPDANGRSAERGFLPNGAYSLSDIEAISLSGGNLTYSIPLAALPASRGGRLKPTVHLIYNSKLYDTQVRMCLGQSCTFKYTQTTVMKAFRGGWTYGTNYFVLTTNRAINYLDGAPPYPHNTYKYKTEIFFPTAAVT